MLLPHSTFKQRSHFYSEVVELVKTGFLAQPMSFVRGTSLSLRTLCSRERFLLRNRLVGTTPLEERSWHVASSIWMFDRKRIDDPNLLYEALIQMPRSVVDALYGQVVQLSSAQRKAGSALEPFLYEDASRALWRLSKGRTLFETFDETCHVWSAYNHNLDKSEDKVYQFTNTKNLMAMWDGKYVSGLNTKAESEEKDREAREQRVHDIFFYGQLGVSYEDVVGRLPGLAVKSDADLREEAERAQRGEEDWHDYTIRKVTERAMSRFRAIEDTPTPVEAAEVEIRDGTNLMVAYTPDQLEKLLGPQKRATTIAVSDEDKSKAQHLFDSVL